MHQNWSWANTVSNLCLYSTGFKKIENNKRIRTATATQRFKVFCDFKNVAHSLEPGETPSNLASHQAPNYVQRS